MYAPLEYVEQVNNYIITNLNSELDEKINSTTTKFLEDLFEMQEFSNFLVHSYTSELDKIGKIGHFTKEVGIILNPIREKYESIINNIIKDYGIRLGPSDDTDIDFFNLLISKYFVSDWKYHKYTYKISKELGTELNLMSMPESILIKSLEKTPAKVFYIDCSEFGNLILPNMEGVFVSINVSNNRFSFCTIAILRGSHGRLMPIYNRVFCQIDNKSDNIDFKNSTQSSVIELEDGSTVTITEKLNSFILNFLIYLQAINKDIQENEVSKETFKKPINKSVKPKNKFKEVRQYEVGYKISSTLKKKRLGKNISDYHEKGSSKSPHFRSAHWHHYWVGSGENKKLIVKWVESVYVNGKSESNVAVVHKVN